VARHPAPQRWTYDAFARLPQDGNRYEVIAGELYVTPAPKPRHQRIVRNVLVALDRHVTEHRLGWVFPGPIDVLFAEGDYLEPDLVFVRRGRRTVVSERGIEAAPDLVVEVLSASTARRDRELKRDRCLHFGVPEYWIVDADGGEVVIHRSGESPDRPEISRDELAWLPWPGAPALRLAVSELLRGLDDEGPAP
jgi:Uma2 family endonuclease